MLVDVELRERLSVFCLVTKQTQEKAANEAIREMLARIEKDPAMSQRLARAVELQQALQSL